MRQEDIAKLVGVSRTTVSRVLNGDPTVKEETKNKILKTIKEMGYERNYISTTLASKKTKLIYAFIVKSKVKYYSEDIKKGFEEFFQEYKGFGIDIKIIETDISMPEKQLEILKEILSKESISGIIITPLMKEEILEIIKSYPKIKFITLDNVIAENIPHVGANYYKSGKIAGDIANGIIRDKEKVLVLNFPGDRVSVEEYYKGFTNSFSSENLIIKDINKDILEEKNFLKKFVTKDTRVIFSNRYLKEIIDLNYELLRENTFFKVIGVSGNIETFNYLKENLLFVTINENFKKIGYKAAHILFEILYKDIEHQNHYFIPATINFKSSLL